MTHYKEKIMVTFSTDLDLKSLDAVHDEIDRVVREAGNDPSKEVIEYVEKLIPIAKKLKSKREW
jgi:hypothetical protein